MPELQTRQLAAVMFADITGYTAMMQENEQIALQRLSRYKATLEQEHDRFGGNILQHYGDGSLSIFKSAVEAVQCAISMQQQLQTGESVPLRIGLHIGDIVMDGMNVFGDGVNVASRIESMGIPGCILVSDRLMDAIRNQKSFLFKSMGHFEFKNILEPMEVFAVTNQGIVVPERAALKGKLKENKKSIAVLPFVNMSADPENEFFSDGIAEEILNALVKVEGLMVTARTSSFSFKGKNMDVREIGSQLGAKHILEGSVRKAGNRVRITAQLVSSVDGYHFFSETFDRTLEDIFEVQDEIAQMITNRLREHLTEEHHQTPLVQSPTSNLEAYETYLRGLYFFYQWSDEAMAKAIPLFQKAITLQDDFGLPHARLILAYFLQAYGGKTSVEDARKKSEYHLKRVREIGVDSAEAYFGNAVFEFFYNWDWEQCWKYTKEGVDKFPNFPSLHHMVSSLYYVKGDMDKAIAAHVKGFERDPLSIEMLMYLAIAYLWNHEYEKAMPYFDRLLEMIPDHRTTKECKGWVYALQGEYEKALAIFGELEPVGYRLHQATCLGWVYWKQGRTDEAIGCEKILLDLLPHSPGIKLDLVTFYAAKGALDKVFHYLELAIHERLGDSMMFRSDPFLNGIKSDPRYQKLEALVGDVPDMEGY